uniref:Uncharacterized protein n=1 Tax=Meloidogyne enterolobii TaxID=390850 RepID=A0A6V7ULZ3_MELEN|nr:unnamed protein product [Meloidogyne enterolobii]
MYLYISVGGRRGPTKPKGRGHVGSRAAKNQKGVDTMALSGVRQKEESVVGKSKRSGHICTVAGQTKEKTGKNQKAWAYR